MKTTKKEIRNNVITLNRSTKNTHGRYQITINGISFNNYQGSGNSPMLVSFPEENYDGTFTTYPMYHLCPDTIEGFITLVHAILNK